MHLNIKNKNYKFNPPIQQNKLPSDQWINQYIQFNPKTIQIQRQIPGVGKYNIAKTILKPTYETYQKPNKIILVKINHIGGTSSFRGSNNRFQQGSIYSTNETPGPGYYVNQIQIKNQKKQQYNQNYSLIQKYFKIQRENIESIPNIKFQNKGQSRYKQKPIHFNKQNSLKINNNVQYKSLPLKNKHRKKSNKFNTIQINKNQRSSIQSSVDEQQKTIKNKLKLFLKSQVKIKQQNNLPYDLKQHKKPFGYNKNMIKILFQKIKDKQIDN